MLRPGPYLLGCCALLASAPLWAAGETPKGIDKRGAAVRLPAGELEHVDFERHVVSLLGKHGCSAGACHGSFQGRGGLRLSLFGHEPAQDFHALTRDAMARRINPADPDA